MALDTIVARRATSAAQSILKEADASLQVDGKPGSFTMSVYAKANTSVRQAADSVVQALGVSGGVSALNADYVSRKTVAIQSGSTASVFDLQVVPAIVRYSRSVGMNPAFPLAQLGLESGWGKSTPKAEDGSPSFNYGGIKWNTVRTPKKAVAGTHEQAGGKLVSTTDAFAVFDSPDAFAKAYVTYLTNSNSSYRFPNLAKAKTAEQFATILKNGDYATDANYVSKVVGAAAHAANAYVLT